jgi:cell division protein FtsB
LSANNATFGNVGIGTVTGTLTVQNLIVNTSTTLSGTTIINDNARISSITGPTTISDLTKMTDATVTGTATMGTAKISTITGPTTINGGATINDGATIPTITGPTIINNGATINGGATIPTITGPTIINNGATINGATSVNTLSATGAISTTTGAIWTTSGDISTTTGAIIASNGNISAKTVTIDGIDIKANLTHDELSFTSPISADAFYHISDERLKTHIRPIENALGLVGALSGKRFEFKKNGKPSIGLIAQNVEKVLPELVSTGSDGMKSVAYANITAVLIEAVKEQQKTIESLKARVDAQEQEIRSLRKK